MAQIAPEGHNTITFAQLSAFHENWKPETSPHKNTLINKIYDVSLFMQKKTNLQSIIDNFHNVG